MLQFQCRAINYNTSLRESYLQSYLYYTGKMTRMNNGLFLIGA